jgi:glutaconate CoA-transferase subunit A
MTTFMRIDGLAAEIAYGASLAVAPDYSGCALAAVAALIRRGKAGGAGGLHLVTVPQAGLQADLLIGAGLVAGIETAAVTLGEYGLAPRFTAAVTAGEIALKDSTCPAIHAGLQAAEKGVPFMPLRGVLGSDLLTQRPDWQVIANPFAAGPEEDLIVLLPAIRPDLALFHAPLADREGNVWIGVRRELMTMAHAARRTLVTVEKVVAENLLADARSAAGTIPALYVSALAEAPGGARPLGLFGCYPPDAAVLGRYAEMAKTKAGFAAFLDDWLAAAPVREAADA